MPLLALDIGSSSTRAALFEPDGRRAGQLFAQRYSLHYGEHGAATLDPLALRDAVRAALAQFSSYESVASCAFWHGLLGLDRKRRPVTPIYTWADSRSLSDAARLRAQFSENKILQRTGCMLRFPFWPAKLRWLPHAQPTLFRRVQFWVSPSDWIFHDLHGELATSESMASGTGLFNQQTRKWDSELCDAAGVKETQLPVILPALADGRVLTAIGDGAASNIGSGATAENIAAINLGTSAAVRVMTRRALRVPYRLFRFVVSEQAFVLGGAISNAGNLRDWCRDKLHLADSARLDREAAARDTLITLPFVVAERSPDWPEFPGAISGYNRSTTPLDIFRTFTTSAFYRLADIFDLLEKSIGPIERIIISGGMSRSPEIVAILADALGRNLELGIETEASLRGAALHAQNGQLISPVARGRLIRSNNALAELHRRRRRKQRLFARSFLIQDPAIMRSKRGRTLA
ncbi:MAG: gluconokinase [Chthoniobacterales bacterium]